MAENNDENQTVPVPGPGPDAPLRENPISKGRSLTLEEMRELNLASDTHAIPPRGAERRENVPCIETEIVMAVKDGIQGAADFVTGGVRKFDKYITDCAETAADFDYELTFSSWFFGLYGLSEFEKGYLGRGGSFSIPKAMGCVGRGAVNLLEGMIAFPAQAIGHPIKTIEGAVQTPMEYMERFRDGNWTERVTAGTEIAAMIGMTAESAMKLKDSLKKEKAMKESAQRETAKSRENGIPGGCFTAGTGVLTKEGLKAIEDIRAGDYVLAEDVESGRQEYKKVVRTTVRRTEKIIHLVIAGEEIETTGDHPFRVTDRGWVPAEELQLYDETELSDGSPALIEDLWQEKTGEETAVYNMEVEEFHTYYIANSGVLVHNNDGCARDSGEVRIRKNEGGSGLETKFSEWKPGDSITKMTPDGEYPSWDTIRQRYWKSRAKLDSNSFSPQNVGRMKKGLAPKARVIVKDRGTGKIYEKLVSKDIHHAVGNRGIPGFDEPIYLREVWPWEHENLLPPGRKLDYDFIKFK